MVNKNNRKKLIKKFRFSWLLKHDCLYYIIEGEIHYECDCSICPILTIINLIVSLTEGIHIEFKYSQNK